MADSPSELQFEIEKLERKHAEHPEGRFFVPLANAYRKMGDIETAEALLRTGVERHPDYLSAHIVLGRCLADRGAVREAEEEFRFVLSQDPQNLIALRTLGELAAADGRPGEAADWYRELLAVDPMNEDARQALETLSGAPAPGEVETEFRSGAGWWEPGDDDSADAAEEGAPEYPSATAGTPQADDSAPREEIPDWEGYGELQELREGAQQESGRDGYAEPESRPEPEGEPERLPGLESHPSFEPFGQQPSSRDREPSGMDEPPAAEARPFDTGFTGREDVAGARPFDAGFAGPEDAAGARPFDAGFDAPDEAAEPEVDDRSAGQGASEVVTETIAELYARQGLHERAASVYRELIRRRGGDASLERRLAEIERMAREEQDRSDLTLADEEALVSPPLDAEEDAFASSFADGFTDVQGEDEAPLPAGDLALDPGEARGGEDAVDVPAPAAGGYQTADFDRSAPAPAAAEPTITHLLADLVRWRPAAAAEAARPHAVEPAATVERPSAEVAESPALDAFAWETDQLEQEEEQREGPELPYLEGVSDAGARGGTGPAEDEPFPWELPGAVPLAEDEAVADETPAPELDPFFVDDVEPQSLSSGQTLPEAPPPQQPDARPEQARAASTEPDEDEDLESFQAWLRSLKR